MTGRPPRRRWRRRLGIAVALAAVLLFVAYPAAMGSDVLSNVGPASQLPAGSLVDAYPLGNYALDHYFAAVKAGFVSGVDVSGIPPTIAWFLAQLTWMATAFLAKALITLFTFAFSLDLVNGSHATGGAGALAPVSDAVHSIYSNVFGEPWLVVAILLTGLWAMWHALVRRRYTETAGALAVSLLFVVIALAFVAKPQIVGQASRWTNQMSAAFLSLSNQGSITGEDAAKRSAADQLFSVLVFEPWVVLEFGGDAHCVSGGGNNPISVPVRPLALDPARDADLSRRLSSGTQVQADGKICVNNANKYARHFLRFAPDTSERNAEHDALANGDTGKLPDADPGKHDGSYPLSAIDKPAADSMDKGGQYQRLLIAAVVFVGELGAFLLLGAISVVVILAQVLVLLVLAFAPVALVIGVLPGRGHDFFRGWLARLGTYLARKAIYSLVLAVLIAVAAALDDAASNLGWLMRFGLQSVFYWTVFLNRKQLVGIATRATIGKAAPETVGLGRLAVIYYAATRMASRRGHRPRAPRATETNASPEPVRDEATEPIHREHPAGGEYGPGDGGGQTPGGPVPSPNGSGPRPDGGDPSATAAEGASPDGGPAAASSNGYSRDGAAPPPPAPTPEPTAAPGGDAPAAAADVDRGSATPEQNRRGDSADDSPLRQGLDADARRMRRDDARRLHGDDDGAARATPPRRPVAARRTGAPPANGSRSGGSR